MGWRRNVERREKLNQNEVIVRPSVSIPGNTGECEPYPALLYIDISGPLDHYMVQSLDTPI